MCHTNFTTSSNCFLNIFIIQGIHPSIKPFHETEWRNCLCPHHYFPQETQCYSVLLQEQWIPLILFQSVSRGFPEYSKLLYLTHKMKFSCWIMTTKSELLSGYSLNQCTTFSYLEELIVVGNSWFPTYISWHFFSKTDASTKFFRQETSLDTQYMSL